MTILLCLVAQAHAQERAAPHIDNMQGSMDKLYNRALEENLRTDLETTVVAKPPKGQRGAAPSPAPSFPTQPGKAPAAKEKEYTSAPAPPRMSKAEEEELEQAEEGVQEESQENFGKLSNDAASQIGGQYQTLVKKVQAEYENDIKNLVASVEEESKSAMTKIQAEVNHTSKDEVKQTVIKYMGKQALQTLINEVQSRGNADLEKVVDTVKKEGMGNLQGIINETQKAGLADLKQLVAQFKANSTGKLPKAEIKKLAVGINATGEYNLEELIVEIYYQAKQNEENLEEGIVGKGQDDLNDLINEVYSNGMAQLEKMLQQTEPKSVKGKGKGKGPGMVPAAAGGPGLVAQSSYSVGSISAPLMIGLFIGSGMTFAVFHLRRVASASKEPLPDTYSLF